MRYLSLAVLALFFTGQALAEPTQAADQQSPDPDRLEIAGFPIVAFSSDTGLALGALGTLAKYQPEYDPHRWRIDTMLVANIQGIGSDEVSSPRQKYYVELDLPRFPADDLRLTSRVEFTWMKIAGYYGLGNDSPSLSDRRDRDHQYEHIYPRLNLQLRHFVTDAFSLFGAFDGTYNSVGVYSGSRLAADLAGGNGATSRQLLHGLDDHENLVLRGGAMWDTRDHEDVPTRGMFHEISLRGGGSVSEEFGYGGANATARFYVPIAGRYLVFAQRTIVDTLFGDAPFYELGFIGDGEMLRGIPIGRFAGKIRMLGNFELRSRFWRFNPFDLGPMHLGAVGFADVGRVWADYDDNPDLDGDGPGLKSGYGGGLRLQWGESFVARGDVAWSPDARDLGIYIGVAHLY